MREILEPLKEFANYQNEFDNLVKNSFEELLKTSKVNVEENRITVDKYNHADSELKKEKKKLNRQRGCKSFLIFLIVASVIAIIIGGLMLYGEVSSGESMLAGILTIVISTILLVTFILLITLVINKKIKVLRDSVNTLRQNADSIINKAWEQMAPLNDIIDCGIARQFVNQLDTVIHIDRVYTVLHEVFLHNNYKLPYFSSEDNSTTNMIVGSINKNPFVLTRELSMEMGNKTYEGSLVVSWTETRRDSKGRSTTVRVSQTLVAAITAPCPFYDNETYLVYGNNAAPDLNFTRRPQALNKDDKQVERMVKKGEKKLEKIAEDDRKHGDGSFIAMSDTEFDVLFGAFDRDNENQFRLLFTPLAQRNMVDFIKDSPYSDDFYFIKQGKLNTIYAHHSDSFVMPVGANISSYSVDMVQEQYEDYNREYFKHLYFMLAPLLNIPIYQQHKPIDMDIDLSNQTNIAGREVEMIANMFPDYFVCATNSMTNSIRKIKYKPSVELVDYVKIYAYSFSVVRKLEYVPRTANNGRTYGVPVYWDEYIPISKVTEALVFDIDGLANDKRTQLLNLLFEYDCSLEMPNASQKAVVEFNDVMMIIPKQGVIEELIPKINKILKTKSNKPIRSIKDLYEATDNFIKENK